MAIRGSDSFCRQVQLQPQPVGDAVGKVDERDLGDQVHNLDLREMLLEGIGLGGGAVGRPLGDLLRIAQRRLLCRWELRVVARLKQLPVGGVQSGSL